MGRDAGADGDVVVVDPLAIRGLTPSHGPFTGGTRASLDGHGFSSNFHVFVGGTEALGGALLASDPVHAAVVVPPGAPGFVDIRLHEDTTASDRVLANGFFYDSFFVAPDHGATTSGTRVTLTASGTAWATGTTVTVAGIPWTAVVVRSRTSLGCVTPPGTAGSKDVVVDGVQVRDAFAFADSDDDGYRGGLSGAALAGRLRVVAFDAFLGTPVAGALAFVGTGSGTTTTNGVAEISGVVGSKATVTVAAPCFSPQTYVDVPVDMVTVYLAPDRGLGCANGDPQGDHAGRSRDEWLSLYGSRSRRERHPLRARRARGLEPHAAVVRPVCDGGRARDQRADAGAHAQRRHRDRRAPRSPDHDRRDAAPYDVFQIATMGGAVTIAAYEDFELTTDGPVLLADVQVGAAAAGVATGLPGGDPSLLLVPPVEQWRSDHTLVTPDTYAFDFLVLTAPAGAMLYLDGLVVDGTVCDARSNGAYTTYRCQLTFPVVGPTGVLPGHQNDGVHRVQADHPLDILV